MEKRIDADDRHETAGVDLIDAGLSDFVEHDQEMAALFAALTEEVAWAFCRLHGELLGIPARGFTAISGAEQAFTLAIVFVGLWEDDAAVIDGEHDVKFSWFVRAIYSGNFFGNMEEGIFLRIGFGGVCVVIDVAESNAAQPWNAALIAEADNADETAFLLRRSLWLCWHGDMLLRWQIEM